jgi:stage II sporulation protein D
VKIRIFSTRIIDKTTVTPDTGLYYLVAYDKDLNLIDTVYDIFDQDKIRTLYFNRKGSNISVKRGKESLGTFKALRLLSVDKEKEFKISANGKNRAYQDDLQIRVYNGHLQLVNVVDINKYVAGVVESEGGHVSELEFFKAQAVLARTFALKNLEKHLDEGYNLKDDVSSQVYFSKCHYKNADCILEAVDATGDTIVVTEECKPILGVFHANSGGQTVGSDHAWYSPIEYLQPKQDSFSIGVGSYAWEKTISRSVFYDYVARKMKVSNDLSLRKALLNFSQKERKAYFVHKSKRLKLTFIRNRFKLKSTFFQIAEEGDYVILRGKGYGHGVGMSQDGAIEMSSRGYNYRDILHFYYKGVELESIYHSQSL